MRRTDLLVLAILTPLVAAPVVAASRRAQDESQVSRCANNLAQMWKMMGNYMVQYGGPRKELPTETGEQFWLKLSKPESPLIELHSLVYQCPVEGFKDEGGDYRGPRTDANRCGDDDPVGADVDGNHGAGRGGNVIRKAGVVQTVRAEDALWKRAEQTTTGGSKPVLVPARSYIEKKKSARVDIGHLVVAVWMYHDIHGEFPRLLIRLVDRRAPQHHALHEDMVPPEEGFLPGGKLPVDPWGNEYQYEVRDNHPHVWSWGADGKKGGTGNDADLTMEDVFPSPERKCRARIGDLHHYMVQFLEPYPASGNRNLTKALWKSMEEIYGRAFEFERRLLNDKGELVDVWGRPYVYRNNAPDFPKNQNDPTAHNKESFDLYSVGPDGIDEKGGGDDIGNWMLDLPKSRDRGLSPPPDLRTWSQEHGLGKGTVEEFRSTVGKLRGQKVRFLVRVFNVESRTGGFTDPDDRKHPETAARALCMSHALPGGAAYLDLPPEERVFLACLESDTTPLGELHRGEAFVVEGTVWGLEPEGEWRIVYLKDCTIRRP